MAKQAFNDNDLPLLKQLYYSERHINFQYASLESNLTVEVFEWMITSIKVDEITIVYLFVNACIHNNFELRDNIYEKYKYTLDKNKVCSLLCAKNQLQVFDWLFEYLDIENVNWNLRLIYMSATPQTIQWLSIDHGYETMYGIALVHGNNILCNWIKENHEIKDDDITITCMYGRKKHIDAITEDIPIRALEKLCEKGNLENLIYVYKKKPILTENMLFIAVKNVHRKICDWILREDDTLGKDYMFMYACKHGYRNIVESLMYSETNFDYEKGFEEALKHDKDDLCIFFRCYNQVNNDFVKMMMKKYGREKFVIKRLLDHGLIK